MLPIQILMVDDSTADVVLTKHAFKNSKLANQLQIARDGAEALAQLRNEPPYQDVARPDLILLDLNMPVMGGHEFLTIVKADPLLRSIPVVVLTTSDATSDIRRAYDNFCSAYITKPVSLEKLQETVAVLEQFWFQIVRLP